VRSWRARLRASFCTRATSRPSSSSRKPNSMYAYEGMQGWLRAGCQSCPWSFGGEWYTRAAAAASRLSSKHARRRRLLLLHGLLHHHRLLLKTRSTLSTDAPRINSQAKKYLT
jgi:hypothetical protein